MKKSHSCAVRLIKLKTSSNRYLVALYRHTFEDAALRPIINEILLEVELKPGTFKFLRQIFKVADMRDDFLSYGILAKRFEQTPSGFSSGEGWINTPSGYVELSKEIVKENSTLAFSNKTKAYFNRRVLRDLRGKGDDKTEYTSMATGILLAFDDTKDKRPPYTNTTHQYIQNPAGRGGNWQNFLTHYDSYADLQSFNYILYKHSPRYELVNDKWTCAGN